MHGYDVSSGGHQKSQTDRRTWVTRETCEGSDFAREYRPSKLSRYGAGEPCFCCSARVATCGRRLVSDLSALYQNGAPIASKPAVSRIPRKLRIPSKAKKNFKGFSLSLAQLRSP